MHKKILLGLFALLFATQIFAQKYTVSGIVVDAETKETLVGVNILFKKGIGSVTDIDGRYTYQLSAGEYTMQISYVGYTTIKKKINLTENKVYNFELKSEILDEVKIVADVAIARKTPVAFSNIEPKQLQENLASQDIPMILNSTPGVYATQEGGGDGDAQITIRGFSSRNVGVLLDGVPVNDMESGKVYWSNWFGLDVATRSIQVQRGLGASKLALPSVGGTINILTKGYDNRRGGKLKQEVGSDGYMRTTVGYNTGKLKHNWALSTALSYKQGNGWVDQTWTRGLFYYLKIDKKLGNHMLSLSGFGAPQSHGQRSYKLPVAVYDLDYAKKLGVTQQDLDSMNYNASDWDMGVRYNQHWGYLKDSLGDDYGKKHKYNERVNKYHKPQFTLKDTWTVNDKLFVSNILYLSIGRGGGPRAKKTPGMVDGQMDLQDIYNRNIGKYTVNAQYDTVEHCAANYMRILKNDHFWYGLVSTVNYKLNPMINISGGVDLRSYKGTHYEEVYDLLGADYAAPDNYNSDNVDWSKPEPLSQFKLKEGSINNYHNDGLVRWGGIFFLGEFDFGRLKTFINGTYSQTYYKRIDYMYGVKKSVRQKETGWESLPGFTIKGGGNYLINDNLNVFVNLGYLNKAPRFNNVYDYSNLTWQNLSNEGVYAAELGVSYHSRIFSANLNSYYTVWKNKPHDKGMSIKDTATDETYKANIRGMDALHKGIELDFVVKPIKKLTIQGLISLGDWRWNSEDTVRIYDEYNVLRGTRYFNAKGIHVGNSAQTQYSLEMRYEIIKGLYVKMRGTYFDKYFAQFDPFSLSTDNPQDSWQVPGYMLVDFHTGYRFKLWDNRFQIRGSVLNLLNTKYIATAQNNDRYSGQIWSTNDARSASVFMGLGLRYSVSLQWSF